MARFIRFLSVVLLIAIALSSFVFTTLNTEEVSLWLGRELAPRPLGQWVVGAFSLGGLLGLLLGLGLFGRLRGRRRIKELEARLRERELDSARLKNR